MIFGPNLLKKSISGKKQENYRSLGGTGVDMSLLLLVSETKVLAIKVKHDFFKNILFPSTMINRSNCLQTFFEICLLKNFVIFTGKQLCWSLKACNFIKKRFQQRCFLMNIAKILWTALFIEQLPWLLVNWVEEIEWNIKKFEINETFKKEFCHLLRHLVAHSIAIILKR